VVVASWMLSSKYVWGKETGMMWEHTFIAKVGFTLCVGFTLPSLAG